MFKTLIKKELTRTVILHDSYYYVFQFKKNGSNYIYTVMIGITKTHVDEKNCSPEKKR